MSEKKGVSIIMSVYNTKEDWLRKAVESILRQTYTDFEFVIVLDAPTDNSESVIREYASRDSRILMTPNEKNLGLTNSLNKAIKVASGQYIARMDSDDIAEKNRIEEQLQYLTKNHLELVGARINRIDQNGKNIGSVSNIVEDKKINDILCFANCVPHPTWFLCRQVYEELGGYRNIDACEDYDFLLRAKKRGIKIGMCDSVLLNYRINQTGITRNNSLKQFLTTDFLQKNYERIEDVNQAEVSSYLQRRITAKEERKYEDALSDTRECVAAIKQKHYLAAGIHLLKSAAKSKYAIMNYRKMFKIQSI